MACSNDDKPFTPPSQEAMGITNPIRSVTADNGSLIMEINYDAEGRVAGGHEHNAEGYEFDVSISYAPFTIMAQGDHASYSYSVEISNIKTNGSGCITRYDFIETYVDKADETKSTIFRGVMTATYAGENRLSSMTYEGNKQKNIGYDHLEYTHNYTWDGNKLVRYDSEERMNDIKTASGSITYTYESDAVANNGIYMAPFLTSSAIMTYAGFFGRTTSHIPSTEKYTRQLEAMIQMRTNTLSVTTDAEGRITTLLSQPFSGSGFSYHYGYAATDSVAADGVQ